MPETTIKGMKRDQLLSLIEGAISDINQVTQSLALVEQNLEKSNDSNLLINGEDGLLSKITIAHEEIEEKITEIRSFYDELFEGDEDTTSTKGQIEDLLSDLEASKNKVDDFKKEIWGVSDGDEQSSGLFYDMNEFYGKQKAQYTAFFKQIEQELKSGTTSIKLAKVFSDKVTGYADSAIFRSRCFSGAAIVLIVSFGLMYVLLPHPNTLTDVLLSLLNKSPFIAFAVWLMVFFGNRRAESKKLEEAYTHKEVMARAFIGYKKSIEDLGDDIDKELAKKHMNNLLDTMNQNSSDFLTLKGDSHPAVDLFKDLLDKKIIPEGLLDFAGYSVEIKKK